MPVVRTRPRPWRRIRHAPYARLSSRDILAFGAAFAARLAEEIRDVMSEDDHLGAWFRREGPVLSGLHVQASMGAGADSRTKSCFRHRSADINYPSQRG